MYPFRRLLKITAAGLLLSTLAVFALQNRQVSDAALKNSGKSWASGIDPKTGRPNINPEAYYSAERGASVAPTGGGAHSWAQMAFNPATGLVYMPIIADSTFNYTTDANFKVTPGAMNLGLDLGALFGAPPAPGAQARPPNVVPKSIAPVRDPSLRAMLSAWDPATQKEKWTAPVGGASGGGVLSTAGNLVFQVTASGHLYAYAADKGTKLLDITIGQNSAGPPMTYMLDNKQYVAVMAGHGLPDSPAFAPPPGTPLACMCTRWTVRRQIQLQRPDFAFP